MADIDLLFGVSMGGESGDSAATIAGQLNEIIKGIEPLKVKVEVDVEGSSGKWTKDLEKLIGADGKSIDLKVSTIDTSGALADFKADLMKVVNSVSLDKRANITIKGLDIGDVSTDLKQVGDAAKDSAEDVARIKAEIKALNTEGASIDALYKGLTKATNVKNSADQIESLRLKYIELNTAMEQMANAGATSSNAYIEKVRVLQSEIKELIKTMTTKDVGSGLEKELTRAMNLLYELTRIENQWTSAKRGKSSGAYNAIVNYKNELISLIHALDSGESELKDFKSALDRISTGAKTAQKQIRSVGEATKSWQDRLGTLFGRIGQWITVSEVFSKIIQTFERMVDCVVDVDTAMTELKKVTDESESSYDRFLTNASDRSRELGATISDTVRATADFARLGYSIDDASALADAAVIYKNVGDGIDSIDQASESIISTMKAFGVEAADVMTIVDKFNKVGNEFPISSTGIGEALLNSASALAAAGNTLDDSIALITAANETIQSPERVGTAMKTLSMYIRAAKTEAEEAGISTEGMANSVSELREEILDLTGQRVDIMIDDENFKGTVEIIGELAAIWDELSGTTKANITELIGGGVRNANVVTALIKNFDTVQDVLNSAADASGSALAENEKYLDSISGRVEKLKASFEAFSTSTINNDLAKSVISLGDALLRVATIFSDVAFDNLFSFFSTAAAGGGIFAFFKNLG